MHTSLIKSCLRHHTFVFQENLLKASEESLSHGSPDLSLLTKSRGKRLFYSPTSTDSGDVIKPRARKPPQLQIVRYPRDARPLDGPGVTTTTQCAARQTRLSADGVSPRTPFQPFSPAQQSSGDRTSESAAAICAARCSRDLNLNISSSISDLEKLTFKEL